MKKWMTARTNNPQRICREEQEDNVVARSDSDEATPTMREIAHLHCTKRSAGASVGLGLDTGEKFARPTRPAAIRNDIMEIT
jgi:hypothetical protein